MKKLIKNIISYLQGNTVYLQDFNDQIRKIAINNNSRCCQVSIELMNHLNVNPNSKYIKYKCYIEGFEFFEGETMQEVISKVKNAIELRNSKGEQKELEQVII